MRWIVMTVVCALAVGGASAATINVNEHSPNSVPAVFNNDPNGSPSAKNFLRIGGQVAACADQPSFDECSSGCNQIFRVEIAGCGTDPFSPNYSCQASAERDIANCAAACARSYC